MLICANVAWHAFASLFFVGPLVWAFVILAALFVIGRSRRVPPLTLQPGHPDPVTSGP